MLVDSQSYKFPECSLRRINCWSVQETSHKLRCNTCRLSVLLKSLVQTNAIKMQICMQKITLSYMWMVAKKFLIACWVFACFWMQKCMRIISIFLMRWDHFLKVEPSRSYTSSITSIWHCDISATPFFIKSSIRPGVATTTWTKNRRFKKEIITYTKVKKTYSAR